MNVSYTPGTHLEQSVADLAPTLDYLPSMPTGPYVAEPGTQTFYVHPATSGYIVETGAGGLVNVSA